MYLHQAAYSQSYMVHHCNLNFSVRLVLHCKTYCWPGGVLRFFLLGCQWLLIDHPSSGTCCEHFPRSAAQWQRCSTNPSMLRRTHLHKHYTDVGLFLIRIHVHARLMYLGFQVYNWRCDFYIYLSHICEKCLWSFSMGKLVYLIAEISLTFPQSNAEFYQAQIRKNSFKLFCTLAWATDFLWEGVKIWRCDVSSFRNRIAYF